MPGAGRPPDPEKKKPWAVRLSDKQVATLKCAGGSPWLQGALNLLGAGRDDALVMLLLDDLEKKHGREWLAALAGKINERVARDEKDRVLS